MGAARRRRRGLRLRRRFEKGTRGREAFRTLFRDRTPGAYAAAAVERIDELVADGRYVEDMYAAG